MLTNFPGLPVQDFFIASNSKIRKKHLLVVSRHGGYCFAIPVADINGSFSMMLIFERAKNANGHSVSMDQMPARVLALAAEWSPLCEINAFAKSTTHMAGELIFAENVNYIATSSDFLNLDTHRLDNPSSAQYVFCADWKLEFETPSKRRYLVDVFGSYSVERLS